MINLINSGFVLALPLLLAGLGDLYSEKSGVLNMGIEASILLSAFASYYVAFISGNVYLGLLVAILVGIGIGALQALFTVTLQSNQVVYGVAINIFAFGLSAALYRTLSTAGFGGRTSPGLPRLSFPL